MQNVYLGYWSEINIRAATGAIFLAATAKQAPERSSSSGLIGAQIPQILLSISSSGASPSVSGWRYQVLAGLQSYIHHPG